MKIIGFSVLCTGVLASANLSQYADMPHHPSSVVRAPIYHRAVTRDLLAAQRLGPARLEKRDPFDSSLYNDQGSQYLVQLQVGTPPQNFTVTFDTGSADLWIPSSSCPASMCPNPRFSEAQSTTLKSLNKPFFIQYGKGNVNGTYATDTVTVAGATVQNQQFGLATATSGLVVGSNSGRRRSGGFRARSLNSDGAVGGILGMGYPLLSAAASTGQTNFSPFVFSLVSQNIIKDPVFSVYLNNLAQAGWVGEVIFGGVDSSKYVGNITYLPVASLTVDESGSVVPGGSSYSYWMVYAQGVAVTNGTSNAQIPFQSLGTFILDTGTTFSYLPESVAQQIVQAVAGSDGYQIDPSIGAYAVSCSTAQSSATVELQMSASSQISDSPVTFSVPVSNLVIPIDADTAENANTCVFGIAPSSAVSSNSYLIGDSILRSAYLVFDIGQNRIGIAPAKGLGGQVQGNGTSAGSRSIQQRDFIIKALALGVLTGAIAMAL